MKFSSEHEELRKSVRKFVETEINPYVDEWEDAEIFPAHAVFKKLGDAGFLGINRPVEFGGLGLDWSYNLLELGEQRLFRRLGAFVGGCSLEAAEAVANLEGELPLDVLSRLAALVDKSLVYQEEQSGGEARLMGRKRGTAA